MKIKVLYILKLHNLNEFRIGNLPAALTNAKGL